MISRILICFIALTYHSCKSAEETCDTSSFKLLNLYPVNVTIKLPTYVFTDSTRYGNNNLVEYKIKTLDSSLVVFAGVLSYKSNATAMPNTELRMHSVKEQIGLNQDSMQLLTEEFKTIHNIKVGFVKYLDRQRKRYESRIFFNHDVNFIDFSLYEQYKNDVKNTKSISDCIFQTLQIK